MQSYHSVYATAWKGCEVVRWHSLIKLQKQKDVYLYNRCKRQRKIDKQCIVGSSFLDELFMTGDFMMSGTSSCFMPSGTRTNNIVGRRECRVKSRRPSIFSIDVIGDFSRGATLVRHPRRLSIGARQRDNEADKGRSIKRKPLSERSDRVNEELLLFFFQLDLTTRLQRALNQDQYDSAKQLREKMAEVDGEISKQREAKMGSASKDEVQDKEITLLQLRNELQKAVEDENYVGAANLRDKISILEAESLAASAKALVYKRVKYSFRLGQKVKHKDFGYKGVICGMDPVCCESEDWIIAVHVDDFLNGRNQPFYQVLADVRQQPSLMVAYVAEENLSALLEPDLERFDHPYVYFLFYGFDGVGDLIPTKQLREKYDTPRYESPWEKDGPKDSFGG